ncbi:hypothetical protein B0H17DRAFT_1215188 [Mycena rosella]|uniref:Uncharacterized protein n=1 Tax=Mycena rosella TaxID=1033263 RepID=A0AAD7FZM1_MYCRO|nr:hypothetical protein B0H17DRAFT_1215188 [Mycena rosella]
MPAPTCNFCSKVFTSWDNVARHKTNDPECRKKVDKNLDSTLERLREEMRAKDIAKAARRNGRRRPQVESPPPSPSEDPDPDPHVDEAAAPFEPQENHTSEPDAVPPGTTPPAPESAPGTGFGRKYWRRDFPGHGGATYGTGKTKFEEIRDDEILKGAEVWGPFKDESEWELAKWLIKNVGHTAADEFLKLSIITECAKPSYKGKNEFFDKIDNLPGGVKWQCKEFSVKGNLPDLDKDPTSVTMRGETVEMW